MSIIFRVPYSLRNLLGGNEEALSDGKNIGECIDSLCEKFPEFKAKVKDGSGEISGDVLLFLNGENVNSLNKAETLVQKGDEISIVPFAAGG